MKNEIVKNLNLELLNKTIIFFKNFDSNMINSYTYNKISLELNINNHSFIIDKYAIGYKNNEIKKYIIVNESIIKDIINSKVNFNYREIEKLSYVYNERKELNKDILDDLFYISIVETDTESDAARYLHPTYEINFEEIKKVMKFLKYVNNQNLKIRLFEEYGSIAGRIQLDVFFNGNDAEIKFKDNELSINSSEMTEIDGIKTLEIKFAKFNYEDYQNFNEIGLNDFIEKNKLINTVKESLKI